MDLVQDDDNPTFRFWNNALGAYVNQMRLYGTFRNEARTLGGDLQLRADFQTAAAPTVYVQEFRGWFTMFDGKLKVLGGKWLDSEFVEVYYWQGATFWSQARPGLAFYAYPMDGLSLGFGINAAFDEAAGAGSLFENAPRYWFGAAYSLNPINVYLNGAYQKDNFNLALSALYDTDDIDAVLDARFLRLDSFDTAGEIQLREFVGYYGVENVGIELTARQVLYGNSNANNGNADIYFDLTGYYTLTGPVTRLGLIVAADIDGNTTYPDGELNFTPFVRFGAAAARNYVDLRYVGRLGFGSNDKFRSGIALSFFWRW